jgi:hypothetical protein
MLSCLALARDAPKLMPRQHTSREQAAPLQQPGSGMPNLRAQISIYQARDEDLRRKY